jgi:hypothetical protein
MDTKALTIEFQGSTRLFELYNMAVDAGLENPFGRAVYALNRSHNASVRNPLKLMTNAKPGTAQRWREHWESGGGAKSLHHKRKNAVPIMRGPAPATAPGPRAISFGRIEVE